jgi:hypothetical protein
MEEKQRTSAQNRASHKFFQMLSDELNTQGLEMKVVLKPEYQIWWTAQSVKEHLWKPLQEAMYGKGSTTQLTTAEVDRVYEQLMKILGEKFGLEVSFPSIDSEASEHYD